jgi:hypothetical protein
MAEEIHGVQQKALKINLDARKFGTFAEIGAGQEVARWFFHVGRAGSTVAKCISAYDIAISEGLYGPTEQNVSRQRLEAMLDREFKELTGHLDRTRGEATTFFVFADTAATHTHSHRPVGHAWLGIRFQTEPRADPSEIIIHVETLDPATADQQEALSLAGVNLIYGAFYYLDDPNHLVGTLIDDLSRRRIEVDLIKFSGPAFAGVDYRLMSLQLVEQGLTDTAMFTAGGEVVQPAEVLYNKPVLIERGGFRPVMNVTMDILDRAAAQLRQGSTPPGLDMVVIMEMALNSLISGRAIDHPDFLARLNILGALGKTVMISNYTRFDRVIGYLRQYTQNWIGMVMGVSTLRQVFEEESYTDLDGGILESLGRLFKGRVKLFVYPSTADYFDLKPELQHLYNFLFENEFIESIRESDVGEVYFTPGGVPVKV